MFEIDTLLVLIPALPLAAALVTAALGKHLLRGQSHLPAVAAVALSCVASVLLVFQVQSEAEKSEGIGYEKPVTLWTWAAVEGAYQQTDADDDAGSARVSDPTGRDAGSARVSDPAGSGRGQQTGPNSAGEARPIFLKALNGFCRVYCIQSKRGDFETEYYIYTDYRYLGQ